MIHGLSPYQKYKCPSLPWLDAIPEHWKTVPNRALLREQTEVVGQNASKFKLLSLTLRGVIPRDMENPKGKFPAEFNTYKVVRPNDLIFCLFDIDETPRGVGLSETDGMITGAYDVFTPKPGVEPRYLYQYYRFVDDSKLMKPLYTGLRKTIPRGTFASLKTPVPPPVEQAAIVRFLEYANRKIDRFIQRKRKLIALLNEQKQGIIHRAVTRGVNPNCSLQKSSVPWLSEAPKNWAWIPIKRLLSRMDYGTSEKSKETGTIRILTMGNIQRGEVILPQSGGLNDLPDSLLLEHHDLLFTRTNGNPDLVGKVGIFRGQVKDRVSFASYLVRFRVKPLYNPEWLHMVLNSRAFWPFARSHALINLQTNLNSTRYGQFQVPVPSVNEQTEIVHGVKEECHSLETAISRIEREIALVQEYRTRLTADIVTGKLDVRKVTESLPSSASSISLEEEEIKEADDLEVEA